MPLKKLRKVLYLTLCLNKFSNYGNIFTGTSLNIIIKNFLSNRSSLCRTKFLSLNVYKIILNKISTRHNILVSKDIKTLFMYIYVDLLFVYETNKFQFSYKLKNFPGHIFLLDKG